MGYLESSELLLEAYECFDHDCGFEPASIVSCITAAKSALPMDTIALDLRRDLEGILDEIRTVYAADAVSGTAEKELQQRIHEVAVVAESRHLAAELKRKQPQPFDFSTVLEMFAKRQWTAITVGNNYYYKPAVHKSNGQVPLLQFWQFQTGLLIYRGVLEQGHTFRHEMPPYYCNSLSEVQQVLKQHEHICGRITDRLAPPPEPEAGISVEIPIGTEIDEQTLKETLRKGGVNI